MKKLFVTAFLFNDDGTHVLLIRKTRPQWQAGKLNGVGGKVEESELPIKAVSREFWEETGVAFDDWELTVQYEGPDWMILYYRGYSTETIEAILAQESYPTDEIPELWPVCLPMDAEETVGNIKWAVPISNDRGGVVFPVFVSDNRPL